MVRLAISPGELSRFLARCHASLISCFFNIQSIQATLLTSRLQGGFPRSIPFIRSSVAQGRELSRVSIIRVKSPRQLSISLSISLSIASSLPVYSDCVSSFTYCSRPAFRSWREINVRHIANDIIIVAVKHIDVSVDISSV